MTDLLTPACSFLPAYIFSDIADASDVDPVTRGLASQVLRQMEEIDQSDQLPNLEEVINAIFHVLPAQKSHTKAVHRKVYTLSNKESTDVSKATLVLEEGQANTTQDIAVSKCFDYLGDTYKFFYEVFDRDSIDDKGLPLVGLTHYGVDCPQALWDHDKRLMWFGDGYKKDSNNKNQPAAEWAGYFGNFYNSLEVVGHELMHGITRAVTSTDKNDGLYYSGETGALMEHVSDAFGLMVKQYKLKHTAEEADWLVGQDIILPALSNMALRSFKAPGSAYELPGNLGKDKQVAHMNQFKEIAEDREGVHIYSGIPNHAFYLAAIKLKGYTWERLGRIWWCVLTRGTLSRFCTFKEFAEQTLDVAEHYGSDVQAIIRQSWQTVGVIQTP